MRVLMIYPKFPEIFWSLEYSCKRYMPHAKTATSPLSLITVASLLPQEWEFKLVDRNLRDITEQEWDWAEFVMLTAMNVQKDDFFAHIKKAKQRGKPVAIGGPYPTSCPEEMEGCGADYIVLDEGEMTVPMFLEALARGETSGTFRSCEKPDMDRTVPPRYDLLEAKGYLQMPMQFSRGCPYYCEFCDVIKLYGQKKRIKSPEQVIKELETLYASGWRGEVSLHDDNFVTSNQVVKEVLRVVKDWMKAKNYPFFFLTEASINMAKDSELMQLMVDCNIGTAFIGIETPDEESLKITNKKQNLTSPMLEAIEKIHKTGIMIMAGMIIGFDGEKPGAGERVVEFVEEAAIPLVLFTMLQALPNTDLWSRLQKEGRLLDMFHDGNQANLMNFVPTRPVEEIAQEYVDAFSKLYDPEKYVGRCYRQAMRLGIVQGRNTFGIHDIKRIPATLRMIWCEGVTRKSRKAFWTYFFDLLAKRPAALPAYLNFCFMLEHMIIYGRNSQEKILSQAEERKVKPELAAEEKLLLAQNEMKEARISVN